MRKDNCQALRWANGFCPGGTARSYPGTKCLGKDTERPRPGGTGEVIVSPAEIGSIVPLGRGNFPHDSRHSEPGYDCAVPPGQNHSPIEVPRNFLIAYGLNPGNRP